MKALIADAGNGIGLFQEGGRFFLESETKTVEYSENAAMFLARLFKEKTQHNQRTNPAKGVIRRGNVIYLPSREI